MIPRVLIDIAPIPGGGSQIKVNPKGKVKIKL